mmetsp:Transcript_16309/g.19824  ORF Transcript_16309/g.19824 Transcript_16309/m.19824 type:complete len:348 (-) Transcript_16309:758-1801(-)
MNNNFNLQSTIPVQMSSAGGISSSKAVLLGSGANLVGTMPINTMTPGTMNLSLLTAVPTLTKSEPDANKFQAMSSNFASSLLSKEQLMTISMTQSTLETEARMAAQLAYDNFIQAKFDPAVAKAGAENVYKTKMNQGQNVLQNELSKFYRLQIQKLLQQLAPAKSAKVADKLKTADGQVMDKANTASEISKTVTSVEGRIKQLSSSLGSVVPLLYDSGEKHSKGAEDVASSTWTAKSLVGKRVEIEWEEKWYPASVQSFDDKTHVCQVLYDTGSPETVVFKERGVATSPDGEDEFQWRVYVPKNVMSEQTKEEKSFLSNKRVLLSKEKDGDVSAENDTSRSVKRRVN